MSGSITSATELCVGAVCLLGAWVSWRRLRSMLAAALLGIAGLTAIGHAGWALIAGR